MKQIKDLKKIQVLELAEAHIYRYRSMIDSGHPAVRIDECRKYIHTWTNIKNKVRSYVDFYSQLTPAEITEITDAVFSDEYAEILGSSDDFSE